MDSTPQDPVEELVRRIRTWLTEQEPRSVVTIALRSSPRDPEGHKRVQSLLEHAASLRAHAAAAGEAGRAEMIELAAWCSLMGGDFGGASQAAREMPASHLPSPLLGSVLAALEGRYSHGIERALVAEREDADAARLVRARCLGGLGRVAECKRVVGDDRDAMWQAIAAAHFDGAYHIAIELGTYAFARWQSPEDAYNVACSTAHIGRPEVALEWLSRAVDAGWRSLDDLDGDPDLASVRELAGFRELRARLAPQGSYR